MKGVLAKHCVDLVSGGQMDFDQKMWSQIDLVSILVFDKMSS
jgi:hypothetical protein